MISSNEQSVARSVVFISKATPGDDEFTLWLAPRLEAAGYEVFADILTLGAGERWRKVLTGTLQGRAVKMLLCCRDATLASDGVQEEIGIAADLSRELNDAKFVIPLRLEPYKKLFGIGELQYIDFVRGWADGLTKLLDHLKHQKVPRSNNRINSNWELYRRRSAISVKNEPERLTSNWLRIAEAPTELRYFEPTGAADRFVIAAACHDAAFPVEPYQQGFFSFGTLTEVNALFSSIGRFSIAQEGLLTDFIEKGFDGRCAIQRQDASNLVHSMLRQAWDRLCRQRALLEYRYSNSTGFHVSKGQTAIGQKIRWGKQGDRRSSMLRNIAKGHVWQFGISALPAFWPFPHFKLKSRVLFSPVQNEEAGTPYDDAKKQHRLRRTVCKGWRNKQWLGRIMALTELLSEKSAYITLRLGESALIRIDASPILFTSPVNTYLPNQAGDEDEEQDITTLGKPEPSEDEDV